MTATRSPRDVVVEPDGDASPRRFRYGAAFALTLLVVMIAIVAPAGDLTRAAVLALESAALVVVVVTSRARAAVRREWGLLAAGAGALLTLGVLVGVVSETVVHLSRASSRSRSRSRSPAGCCAWCARGATLQAVAGAVTIYLCLGLAFAWIVGVVSRLDTGPYFTNGTDGTESDRVYYSFTVLTTTGFGDWTASTQLGHSLAVLEMLVGQLYS